MTFSRIAGFLRQVAAGFGIAIGGGAITTGMTGAERVALIVVSGIIFAVEHHNAPSSPVLDGPAAPVKS